VATPVLRSHVQGLEWYILGSGRVFLKEWITEQCY